MIRWSIQRAAVEFGLHRETLAKYLHREGVRPGADGKYSTLDICKGVFGDLRHEQTRETRERADKLEMENRQKRRELIPAGDVYCSQEGTFIAIRQRILSSGMTEEEKHDLLTQLHSLRSTDLYKLGREALWKEFTERNGAQSEGNDREHEAESGRR